MLTLPDGQVCRVRRKVRLGTKRDLRSERLAWRAFQPYVDRANATCVPVKHSYPNPRPNLVSAHIPNPKAVVSFETFAEKWEQELAIHMKFSARETVKSHIHKWLHPAFGKRALGDLRAEAVQMYFNSMRDKASAKTIRNVRNTLASILKQARAWEYIAHEPLAGLTLPKYKLVKKKAYTTEQVAGIILHSPKQYQTLFFLLAETGLRSGEAAGLEIQDVDTASRKISISRAVWRGHIDTPKTDAGVRRFSISARLSEMLAETIGDRTSGSVFESRNGTPLDMHNICNRVLRQARQDASVEFGDMHTFRHFNATAMDSLHIPMAVRRMRLGHADVSITDGYTNAVEKDDKETAEKIAALIVEKAESLDPSWTLRRSDVTNAHA